MKGSWMEDITQKPTLAEKIKFAHDASDIHLFWADYLRDHLEYAELMGDEDWHLECAVLHEESAVEFEELAQQQGKQNPGCLSRLLGRG